MKYEIISYYMGIGDWGLGIGDWGLGPIPNPQIPICFYNFSINIIKPQKYYFSLFYKFK